MALRDHPCNHECARGSRWITLRAEDEHPVSYEPGNVLVLRLPRSADVLYTDVALSQPVPSKRRPMNALFIRSVPTVR